jgi:hypothetical protein
MIATINMQMTEKMFDATYHGAGSRKIMKAWIATPTIAMHHRIPKTQTPCGAVAIKATESNNNPEDNVLVESEACFNISNEIIEPLMRKYLPRLNSAEIMK